MPRLNQKLRPSLSKTGKARNRTSDGKTCQKTGVESSPITGEDEPSTRSQMKASSNVRERAATSAAKLELRFAISDTATTMSGDYDFKRVE